MHETNNNITRIAHALGKCRLAETESTPSSVSGNRQAISDGHH